MLNWKTPEPSTKKGRRSLKKSSKASRFRAAGSASTWPKSGLSVAVSVSAGVTAYFRSTPALAPGSACVESGLPASTDATLTCPSE